MKIFYFISIAYYSSIALSQELDNYQTIKLDEILLDDIADSLYTIILDVV